MIKLSIVTPCFNEQEVLNETANRLTTLLKRLVTCGKIDSGSRIYFVDDGSKDKTWPLVEDLVRSGMPVVGVKLSRNRGHQNALLAGLFSATGDAVVSVDADLQDDLDAIEVMLDHYLDGCDIVYGVRKQRKVDTFFKRFSAEMFYRMMAVLGAQTVFNHADYRLLSRRAIEALKQYREVNLYLRGIIPLIGFKSAIVEYQRSSRFAGESKYPFRKMASLALNAVTSLSAVPLRMISLMGLIIFLGSMAFSAWALWAALFSEAPVPGWASIVLPMYFLGGVQLLSLGVIGEYLGKLYVEAKARPRFLIEAMVGDAAPGSEMRRTAAPALASGTN